MNITEYAAIFAGMMCIGLFAVGCTATVDDDDEEKGPQGPVSEAVDTGFDEGLPSEQVVGINYSGLGSCRDAGLTREIPGAAGWVVCELDLEDISGEERSQLCAENVEVQLESYPSGEGGWDFEISSEELIHSVLVRTGEGASQFYHYSDAVLAADLRNISADISEVSICLPAVGELGVGKHLFPDYRALVEWQLESVVDAEWVGLESGESAIVNHYALASIADVKLVDYRVAGDIFVVNTRKVYAELKRVKALAGTVEGKVDCGVEFPYILQPGESLHCRSLIEHLDVHHGRAAAVVEVTGDSPLRGGSYENTITWPSPEDASHVDGIIRMDGLLHQTFHFSERCQWWDAPCGVVHSAKFDCPDSAGIYHNAVEIPRTAQQATSTVEVVCSPDLVE